MLSIVVAMANDHLIGNDNTLPWYLPNDLKKFKNITMTGSKTMIMGRKTFESLKKVLPGRKHIILTRNSDFTVNDPNVEIVHSIDDIKDYINSQEEYFVIGGGEIFRLLFPYVSKMYITLVEGDFQGQVYFPKWQEDEWKIVDDTPGITDEKNKYPHIFLTLVKK